MLHMQNDPGKHCILATQYQFPLLLREKANIFCAVPMLCEAENFMSQTLGWLHGPEFGPIQFRQIKLWVFDTLAMGFPGMICFPDVEVIPSFALFFSIFSAAWIS